MTPRQDLIELGQEALMALANPGFVKRAQKDIAAGLLPSLSQDEDGTVHASFEDGIHTQLGPTDSLRAATCTCAAGGMCRHRIALVLAYQKAYTNEIETQISTDHGWSPAQFDDAAVAEVFTPAVIEQARKLALSKPIARVLFSSAKNVVPSVHLPMSHVRFFSSSNLAHTRCDCQQGISCVHVLLAIWAFRQAHPAQPDATEVTLEVLPFGQASVSGTTNLGLQSAQAQELIGHITAWAWLLWSDGSSQPLLGLEGRYSRMQASSKELGWTWVAAQLEVIWLLLHAQAKRSNRFDILDLVAAITHLWARLQGAQAAERGTQPLMLASQILGIGQKGEVALDRLRLISLGVELWRDDLSEGANFIFADPDTQSVSVWERSWTRVADDESLESLLNRRLIGQTLKTLANGQLVSKAAKRRANAVLELGANSRQTSVLPLSPKSWDDLQPPLKFSRLSDLIHSLKNSSPPYLRPALSAGNWHVVTLRDLTLNTWSWDAAQQTVFASWQDTCGNTLCAYLPYQQLTPGAVDALAQALNGTWGALHCISGPVWLEQEGIGIRPISLMTQQRSLVLALEPALQQTMAIRQIPLACDLRRQLLRESHHLLGQLLRQGLRHAPPSQRLRVSACSKQLADAGFTKTAQLMAAVFARDASQSIDANPETSLATLATLTLLLNELQSPTGGRTDSPAC